MKKLIHSLTLSLVLVLLITACGTSDQGSTVTEPGTQEQAPDAAMVGTPTLESITPESVAPGASGLTTQEPTAMPTEASSSATEEPAAMATEPGGLPAEEPAAMATEDSGMTTDEAQAGGAETPMASDSAQAPDTTQPGEEVLAPTGSVNVDRLSNLSDFEVWNLNDEHIGDINAIVINQDTSQIEYVIVGIGGFLELGEKDLPVPWQALQIRDATTLEAESSAPADDTQPAATPQNVFILDMSRETLEQAPEFDLTSIYEPGNTDGVALPELEQQIHSFWQDNMSQNSTDTTAEAAETDQTTTEQSDQMAQTSGVKNLVLADSLFGASVRDQTAGVSDQPADTQSDAAQADVAQDLGTVEEIMVDANTGKVTYVLVSLNTVLPMDNPQAPVGEVPPADTAQEPPVSDIDQATIQAVPVPLTALTWNAEDETLIYTGSKALDQAPTVDLDAIMSDQSTSDWQSQADSFWGVENSSSNSSSNE